ncbi:hypothetical protein [Flindersiella endophytica]
MGAPNILIKLDGNTIMAAGIERMAIPEGGPHVREAAIQVPAKFTERPTVTATVSPRSGPAIAGTVFGVFAIKVVDLGKNGGTQIDIQAANVQTSQPVEGEFGCDYVIVGKVA